MGGGFGSEAELSPGEAFDLRATVGNRGAGEASATTLRYYRSANETITAADAEVDADAVAALAAAGSTSASISLTAPSTAGNYYYGACVDAVAEETNTANNCSAAAAVPATPTGLPLGLSIDSVSGVIGGSPDTADANTASATVAVADHVVFLDVGRVLEEGTHTELMARGDGNYRRFVDLQTSPVD